MIARDRSAGRMTLGEAGVGKPCSVPVCPKGRRDGATDRIGGKIIDVSVATCAKQDRIGSPCLGLTCGKITGYDSFGMTVKTYIRFLGI